jgi:hypothetical protein
MHHRYHRLACPQTIVNGRALCRIVFHRSCSGTEECSADQRAYIALLHNIT